MLATNLKLQKHANKATQPYQENVMTEIRRRIRIAKGAFLKQNKVLKKKNMCRHVWTSIIKILLDIKRGIYFLLLFINNSLDDLDINITVKKFEGGHVKI